jgi:hypothetical protein
MRLQRLQHFNDTLKVDVFELMEETVRGITASMHLPKHEDQPAITDFFHYPLNLICLTLESLPITFGKHGLNHLNLCARHLQAVNLLL